MTTTDDRGDHPLELFRALGRLAEPPGPDAGGLARLLELGSPPSPAEHTELFVHQLYPYASVYLDGSGMLGGLARDRIAGFWQAVGWEPPAEPDHLTTLLAAYARLGDLEADEQDPMRRDGLRRARTAFLWEHLLSWLPGYLFKCREIAARPYRRWSELLEQVLHDEVSRAGVPPLLPLHLREAPGIVDPRQEAAETFLSSLLAPVRSGVILTRRDLHRAADALGLGVRLGDRRLTLESLLGQEAGATLGWLADEARRWTRAHMTERNETGPIAAFWTDRARVTADLLEALHTTAMTSTA